MSVKRKDFQKIATTIHQFLLKLTDTYECAELRDSLNLSLLQLQKYYRKCQQRLQHTGRYKLDNNGSGYVSPRQSLRITLSRSRDETLSPMTPYIEEPQYFHAHWTVLEERADVLRRSLGEENMNVHRSINTPPVHYAAMKADFDMLTELHKQKPDVLEDQDCIGRTPMMYAAFHNKISVIRWLLDRGANPNSCDYNEVTALHWSCSQGYVAIIELLLDAGADKDSQDSFGRSATHWACTCSDLDVLQLLIEFETNINLHDRNGLTPSMWACRLDHLDHLRLLVSVEKQNIDHIDGYERDRNGRTTVHWSIRRQGPFECLRYLLNEETAQLKDDEGKTVLLLAAEQGSLETCKIIIETFGTRFLSDVDDRDRTCLHLATVGGHGEVVNFMLENGMNLHCKDKTGATCMEIARNQYLFYCQLIISSHVREMERKLDSVASDGVEVIHNIVSRHNSVPDHRNQVITPPRPPKSPKSTSSNSQNPQSPSLKRRLQNYGSNTEQSQENNNGFDIMSSEPTNNLFNEMGSPRKSRNTYDPENRDDEPIQCGSEQATPSHNSQILHYVEGESIDYLDNDTGQQYHGSPKHQINGHHGSLNNSINTQFEDQSHHLDTKVPKRTLKRAQQANRITSANSDADNETPHSTNAGYNDPVSNTDRELSGHHRIANSPPMESGQRINYGATLEPIRMNSQPVPRRKKKRNRPQHRMETQSEDRFSHLQHLETDNSSFQAMSLENLSSKQRELPNGLVNRRPVPAPIGSRFDLPNKNVPSVNRNTAPVSTSSLTKPRTLWGNDYPDKSDNRSSRLIKPMEDHNAKHNRTSFPNF